MSTINTEWYNYNKKLFNYLSDNPLYKKAEDVISKHPSLAIINNKDLLNDTIKQAEILYTSHFLFFLKISFF